MAGEAILINPRHRRSRRRKARSHRRRRTRTLARVARRNPFINRRRRSSRRAHARRGRRRVHRNPLGGIGRAVGGAAMTGLGVAGGIVITNVATSFLIGKVPGIPEGLKAGPGKMALKGVVGVVALPMLLKALKQPRLAKAVAVGAWAAIVIDGYKAWIEPQLAAAGLPVGVYEEIGEYEAPGELQDYGDDAIGAGENVYADTMYGY